MLNPSVQAREHEGYLLAEFWDCLRLDPKPVADLRQEFERHAARGGKPVVVIDMNGVGFAGSTALAGFVAIRKQGARIILCNVEPTVREVFRVSKLEPMFTFAADLDAAFKEAGATGDAAASDGPTKPRLASGSPPPLRRRRDGD